MSNGVDQVPLIHILGTRVHMVETPDVISQMDKWLQAERGRCHHVVHTGMHGIINAHRDPEFRQILNAADLFAPDGILVILTARLRGYSLRKSKTGPELMWEFGKIANQRGYKYFLYGDTDETLKLLVSTLAEEFPNVRIVGAYAPPFRPLTAAEDESIVRAINEVEADVLWVGLGAPRQERWISEHIDRLNVPIAIGVGASFKFHAGKVKRAPRGLRDLGFEWLWRLVHEPTRMWRRVFIDAPQYIGLVALELSGLKKYN